MRKDGRRRRFEGLFAVLMHELGHIWSMGSGHHVFEPDDEESEEAKRADRALDAISHWQAQTMLKGGMVAKEFVDKMKRVIDNVR